MLLQFQREMRPLDEVPLRCPTHPKELSITGIPIMCPACGARRAWMVICDRAQVRIRCRCAHQWHEPELTHRGSETMIDTGGTDYRAWKPPPRPSAIPASSPALTWTNSGTQHPDLLGIEKNTDHLVLRYVGDDSQFERLVWGSVSASAAGKQRRARPRLGTGRSWSQVQETA
jgi:hypothetical protein